MVEPGSPACPVLTVTDLRTHFFTEDGVVRAVDGVSFEVRSGEMLALVGESGSGKSVTSLSIMRLLARTSGRIEGGEVRLVGRDGRSRDLVRLEDAEMQAVRGREIAMIFQDPMASLNPVFTIGDQIAETIVFHRGAGRREARARAEDLLAMVGIADPAARMRAYPHELSGGMRQRVMIAIALSCDPLLLIADEPTTALDVTIQAQILDLLERLRAERQMAVLFITHDLDLVAEVAARLVVMYGGQVVEEGETAEILAAPRHPYTRALLECRPRRRAGAGGDALRPIPGAAPDPRRAPEGCRFHPRCRFAIAACRAAPIPLLEVARGHRSRCIRWRELA